MAQNFLSDIKLGDNIYIRLGSAANGDLHLHHNGNNSYIQNDVGHFYIKNRANDGDIVFQSDDGSGGVATYYTVDGGVGQNVFSKDIVVGDNVYLRIGNATNGDLQIFHNGSNSHVQNATGDLYVENLADDKDVIFRSDDGSGGFTTYFYLDGSLADGTYNYTRWNDGGVITIGTDLDLRIWHDPSNSNSYVRNYNGHLLIENTADDKDIIFKSDDGSGGTATYFALDGGITRTVAYKNFNFQDNVKLEMGTGADLQIYHDGSNSFISDQGTGLLKILSNGVEVKNAADNSYMAFFGSTGASELYFNGSKKLETANTGVKVSGDLMPSTDGGAYLGAGSGTNLRWAGIELSNGAGIQWTNGDARIIEGLVNNYSLSFQTYDSSTTTLSTALRLDGDNLATFEGNLLAKNRLTVGQSTVNGAYGLYAAGSLGVGGNASFAGDVTVTGNLIINGTTTTINTATVEVEDNILQLNTTQGSPDTATAATSGISIYRGDGVTQASFIFDDGDDTWDLTNNLKVASLLTVGPGTTGSPYDSTTFLHVKGTTRSIVQQSSTTDAYYMFGDAAANNVAWIGYNHSSNNLNLQSGSTITLYKPTNIVGNLTVEGSIILTGASNEIIKSNGSVRIDIDNNDDQTDRLFIVSKHNSATELFRIDESGLATFADDIKLADNKKIKGTTYSAGFISFESDGETRISANDDVVIGYAETLNIANNGVSTFAGNLTVQGATTRLENNVTVGNSSTDYLEVRYNDTANYATRLKFSGLQLGNNGVNKIIAGRTGVNGYFDFYVNNTNDGLGGTPDGDLALTIAANKNATFTGQLIIESAYPTILLTDTNNNDDWGIYNNNGKFLVYNQTDAVSSFQIDQSNNTTFAGGIIQSMSNPYTKMEDTSSGGDTYGLNNNQSKFSIYNWTDGREELYFGGDGNATFTGDVTVSGGDITLGTDVYAKKIYRSTATISSSSYTTVATVNGDNLSSAVRMVVTGTSGNVVMANIAEIIVNHSTDILIKTTNSFYRKLFIKVVSNNNEDFAIELKRDGDTNNTTIQIEIEPLGNETITFTNSHSYSSSTLEHESLYGETTSSNDTAGNHFHKNMLDYQKIKLGNSADLELYHDGTNSIIDNDTGDLIIRSDSDDIKIIAQDDVVIRDNDDSTNMARFINGGAVELYYNGNKKIETTNTGIDVTGTTNTDNLTIAGAQGSDGQVLTSTGSGVAWETPSTSSAFTGGTVANDTTFQGNVTINSVFPRIYLIDNNNNSDYSIINGNGTLRFYDDTNSTDRLTISSSGNATFTGDVTIGGTSSEHRTLTLQTNSEKNSVINLKEGGATYGFSMGYYGVANDFIIKRHDNSTNGTDVFTLYRENSNATFAGDITVNGGDFNLTKQNGSPYINMLYDGTNPGTNTLLHYFNFRVDYDGTHQDWGGIEHRTNASAVRTDLRFNVKSSSGNVQTGLAIRGQASAAPLVGIGTSDPDAKLEILGNGRTSSTTSLRVRSDDDQQLFYVRDDGVVSVTHNYFYVDNSSGMYSNGKIHARGGVTDDGGTLGLGGSNAVDNLVLTSNTSALFKGHIHLDTLGSMISFYGNSSEDHAIVSKDLSGNAADDLRINSYGGVFINLDSNGNNGDSADFKIVRHSSTGAVSGSDTLFTLRHEDAHATFAGDVVVNGDFQVNGITTTTNVVNLDVSDNIIGLNRGSTSNSNDSGLIIERGSTGDNAAFLWDEGDDAFIFGTTTANPAATGNITYAFSPIKAGAATLTSTTSPILILNPTANNYGGVQFNYGGATKGLAMYNSGFMVFGGEAGTDTRLQAGGQYAMHIDEANRNVHIGGTSDTSYKLAVNGTLYAAGNATFAGDIYVNGGDIRNSGGSSTKVWTTYNSTEYWGGQASVDYWICNTSCRAPKFIDTNNTAYYLDPANSGTSLKVAGKIESTSAEVTGPINGVTQYTKSYGSLDTTGQAVAGLLSSSNGASAMFVFETGGSAEGGYQKVVYNCINVSGTWNAYKDIDEGGNKFDVVASANGSTITFTFKARSATQYYTPRVIVKAIGGSIINTSYI